jgi:hypothetical protein
MHWQARPRVGEGKDIPDSLGSMQVWEYLVISLLILLPVAALTPDNAILRIHTIEQLLPRPILSNFPSHYT